jgi:hypothetical protein
MIDEKTRLTWDDVLWIRDRANDNLKEGRTRYAEIYGMKVSDKNIDAAILRLFDKARDRWSDGESEGVTVAVPLELLLAITLREGFKRGVGRPEKSTIRRRNLIFAISWAKKRAVQLRDEKMRKGPAKEEAINEAAERFGRSHYGTTAAIIRDNWSQIRNSRKKRNA